MHNPRAKYHSFGGWLLLNFIVSFVGILAVVTSPDYGVLGVGSIFILSCFFVLWLGSYFIRQGWVPIFHAVIYGLSGLISFFWMQDYFSAGLCLLWTLYWTVSDRVDIYYHPEKHAYLLKEEQP